MEIGDRGPCVGKSTGTSGQFYKASASISYDSRAVLTCNLLIFTTLELYLPLNCLYLRL